MRRFILLLVLLAVLVFLTCVHNYQIREGFEEKSNDVNNKKEYLQALGEIAPAPQVQPGPQGPQGEPGPPGGAYQARGTLLNLAHPALRLDRYYGSGVNAFLNKPNYRSQQTWTLQTDGQIANQFGGCLKRDSATDQVFVSQCKSDNPPSDQLWTFDQYGRLSSRADNNTCLEVSTGMDTTATRGGGLIEGQKGTGNAVPKDTPVLGAGKCTSNNNQVWNFS